MIYILIPFLIGISYYTFSYGIFIQKEEKNKLAATGTILLALLSILAPIIAIVYKSN